MSSNLTTEEIEAVRILLGLMGPEKILMHRGVKVPSDTPYHMEDFSVIELVNRPKDDEVRKQIMDHVQFELETRIGAWKAERLIKKPDEKSEAPASTEKPTLQTPQASAPSPPPAPPINQDLARYLDDAIGWQQIRQGPGPWIYSDGRNLTGAALQTVRELKGKILESKNMFKVADKVFKLSISKTDLIEFINCWPALQK